MTSLRRTALIGMTALLGTVGIAAFVFTYEMARREAASFLDGQLRQIALNAGAGVSELGAPSANQDPEDEIAIEIWGTAGEHTRKPASVVLPRQSKIGFATISAGGEDWRVYLVGDSRRMVQVGQRMVVRNEMAQTAALQAGLPILATIPLAWILIGGALSRLLGRLSHVTQAIAARGVATREPIDLTDLPAEVKPLAEAMNGLIHRLQSSVEQQKRFVEDAAHELRTPLTVLQLQINNLSASTEAEREGHLIELRAGIRRLSALVDQLLRMARVEGSNELTANEILSLSDLVTQCVADSVVHAANKGVDLGMTVCEPVIVTGSCAELNSMIGNLIDNAIRYTPRGGVVDVSLSKSPTGAVIEVRDSGCGVAELDLPRVFDRFFRAAPAGMDGSGLGLSIVDAIAKRHGWLVDLRNRTDRSGLVARVVLPQAVPGTT